MAADRRETSQTLTALLSDLVIQRSRAMARIECFLGLCVWHLALQAVQSTWAYELLCRDGAVKVRQQSLEEARRIDAATHAIALKQREHFPMISGVVSYDSGLIAPEQQLSLGLKSLSSTCTQGLPANFHAMAEPKQQVQPIALLLHSRMAVPGPHLASHGLMDKRAKREF